MERKYSIGHAVLWSITAILFLVIIESFHHFGFWVADRIYPSIMAWDPDKVFIHISIHHIVQMVLALWLILLIKKVSGLSMSDFGFQKKGFKEGIGKVGIFFAVWVAVQVIITVVMINNGSPLPAFLYPDTPLNFWGDMGFQLLLSGPGEEILFRALPIPLLLLLGKKAGWKNKTTQYLTAIVTILIFVVGHIGYTLFPPRIVYYHSMQLLTVVTLGIAYAYFFFKYKNIYLCMILHSAHNMVAVLMVPIFTAIF